MGSHVPPKIFDKKGYIVTEQCDWCLLRHAKVTPLCNSCGYINGEQRLCNECQKEKEEEREAQWLTK
mgnify:CR=1 FL=1